MTLYALILLILNISLIQNTL